MSFDLFRWRTVWRVTPAVQIGIIIACYLAMVAAGYLEWRSTGLLQGYPVHVEVLFVPVYEEMIFRGLILGALLAHTSPMRAIAYSSLLFGIWHLKNIFYDPAPQVLYQVAYTGLFFGPVTAYLAVRTRTIWPGVILHYLNNLLAPLSWMLLGMMT